MRGLVWIGVRIPAAPPSANWGTDSSPFLARLRSVSTIRKKIVPIWSTTKARLNLFATETKRTNYWHHRKQIYLYTTVVKRVHLRHHRNQIRPETLRKKIVPFLLHYKSQTRTVFVGSSACALLTLQKPDQPDTSKNCDFLPEIATLTSYEPRIFSSFNVQEFHICCILI